MAPVAQRTYISHPLATESIMGSDKYVRLLFPFKFYSKVLRQWVVVPAGFVFDFESVPFIRGTCPEAGCAHDYLSRKDSSPVVSKAEAADVYFEILEYVYAMDENGALDSVSDWLKKWVKYLAVYCWPGYFHRHSVMATYEEVSG